MSLSTIQICNMALGRLGVPTISTFEDNVPGELCGVFYETTRDACLELVDWTFARSRKHLVATTEEVVGADYSSVFLLPADCLVVRAASQDGSFLDRLVWEKEGRKIYTSVTSLDIKYTAKVTDPTKFSASFTRLLGIMLAAELCLPITEDAEKAVLMEKQVQLAVEQHCGVDGQQAPTKRTFASRITNARFGGRLD